MKTPIQEAIDFINELNDKDTSEFNYYHSAIIEKLNELLEKEKERICNAYTDGLEGPYLGAEEYYIRTYNQKGIDAGQFLADLLTKELEELGDEDLEPREETNRVLEPKEAPEDPTNSIYFRWDDTNEVILRISKDGFYYRGELVEDIYNVYERFNEWLTRVEGEKRTLNPVVEEKWENFTKEFNTARIDGIDFK